MIPTGTRIYINDTFSNKKWVGKEGVVLGPSGPYLRIKLDTIKKVQIMHPQFISVKENDQHTPTF